jgi:predicted ABC-type ATPase
MQPKMIIVAGPPGSGKSTAFPVKDFGLDYFNADDRAAELNGGSYQGISPAIRSVVNKEYEQFVLEHIQDKKSFALETTLRTEVTFKQALEAKQAGFQIEMIYLSAGDLNTCLKRVIARGLGGGHSAPVEQLQKIYQASLNNLTRAIRDIDNIRVYDNSFSGKPPELVLEAQVGQPKYMLTPLPEWLTKPLKEIGF